MSSFRQAVEHANLCRGKKFVPDEQLMEIYSYYKQGTSGDCDIPMPSILNIRGLKKWRAWNKLKGMSSSDSQIKYIQLVEKYLR